MKILVCSKQYSKELDTLFHNVPLPGHIEMKLEHCFMIRNEQAFIEQCYDIDVLVMDLTCDGDTLLHAAIQVRRKNKKLRILLCCDSERYVKEGYKTGANLYFTLPITQDAFNREFHEIMFDYLDFCAGFFLRDVSQKKLYFKDILYIEADRKYTILHFNNKQSLCCHYTMKRWGEILNRYFFCQSHRSYVVNLRYVKDIDPKTIVLHDNTYLPLTNRYKEIFQNEYNKYALYTFEKDSS